MKTATVRWQRNRPTLLLGGGTGRHGATACQKCSGRGLSPQAERIKVKIPPGISDGGKVRVAGKGQGGTNGGPPGDLYLTVRVGTDPLFTRKGTSRGHSTGCG